VLLPVKSQRNQRIRWHAMARVLKHCSSRYYYRALTRDNSVLARVPLRAKRASLHLKRNP
jgi:hypothetical protein